MKGIFSAEELAACHVVDRKYPPDEYWALTDLQRQKLYMLRNPNKTLGSGPTRQTRRRGGRKQGDSVSVASTNTSGTKRSNEDRDAAQEGNETSPPSYGRNRDNPAVLGRQVPSKARKTDADN